MKVYGTPRLVKVVRAGNFSPPPSVDSAILAVSGISRANFKDISEKKFFEVVKTGFAQKRKMLSGNLKRAFGERAQSVLSELGIPKNARAEDVALSGWLEIVKKLQKGVTRR